VLRGHPEGRACLCIGGPMVAALRLCAAGRVAPPVEGRAPRGSTVPEDPRKGTAGGLSSSEQRGRVRQAGATGHPPKALPATPNTYSCVTGMSEPRRRAQPQSTAWPLRCRDAADMEVLPLVFCGPIPINLLCHTVIRTADTRCKPRSHYFDQAGWPH